MFQSKIQGKKISCLIDTGATRSIIRKSALSNLADQIPENDLLRTTLQFRDFEINDVEFVIYDFEQPQVDAIIGHDFLMKHLVVLDFKNNLIAFD